MRFTQQHIINILLLCISALGLWIVFAMLSVNTIRGDEFLSYLHSDPRWTYAEIIRHIHGGADNSYVHAVLLRWAFGVFGHTILVQRALSMFIWMLGLIIIYGVVKRIGENRSQYLVPILIGFSNFGFFLATDGRFYSLLFLLAASSLYLYVNRQRWSSFFLFGLFFAIQLFGLLTSAIFSAFQLLFLLAISIGSVYNWNKHYLVSIGKWGGCMVLSMILYFTFFKIPYFHSYFLNGFFSGVPFCINDINVFVSIPFRWLMLPHFPYCSDRMDVLLFSVGVLSIAVYHAKGLLSKISQTTNDSGFMLLMALGVIAGLLLQVLLYVVKGYPLWESRYYAAIFFLVPMALIFLFSNQLTDKVMIICCCLWMIRLTAVEYPKIEERKNALSTIGQTQSEIVSRSKPTLFVEHEHDYQLPVFGLMGNIYVHYPETRGKLFLMSDSSNVERTEYFKRLSDWHYPLGLVFQPDSTSYYVISSQSDTHKKSLTR